MYPFPLTVPAVEETATEGVDEPPTEAVGTEDAAAAAPAADTPPSDEGAVAAMPESGDAVVEPVAEDRAAAATAAVGECRQGVGSGTMGLAWVLCLCLRVLCCRSLCGLFCHLVFRKWRAF